MHKHEHWLPQLIVKADKYDNAGHKFLETYILEHTVNGRIHAEIIRIVRTTAARARCGSHIPIRRCSR